MFSRASRCNYQNNPLGEVICQLRFPEILTIETDVPAAFQDAIRDTFPLYSCRKESPAPKLMGNPQNFHFESQNPIKNHQFTSADGVWRVNLTSNFISMACSQYTDWESFALRLDQPLAAFIQIYRPVYFERTGLRYVNLISRNKLGLSNVPFRELIQPMYLGVLADDEIPETATTRCSIDTEFSIRGGCRAKLHAGPGLVKRNGVENQEVHFVFDQDLFMPGKLDVKLSAGALQTLHAQAWSIFRGAITDTLHDAMSPTYD